MMTTCYLMIRSDGSDLMGIGQIKLNRKMERKRRRRRRGGDLIRSDRQKFNCS